MSPLFGWPGWPWFEIGVALDLIITEKTGYRAQRNNSKDLANGIYSILNLSKDKYESISKNCIKISADLLTINNFSKKLTTIIKDAKA